MRRFLLALTIAMSFIVTANAQPRHHRHHHHHKTHITNTQNCFLGLCNTATVVAEVGDRMKATFLPHPRGCPARNFCACGASVEIFGRSIRSLWPAAAWFSFPRTEPAPNMVGVRRHHIVVLKRHIKGSVWLVYDANSGGHRTRLHQRSIAGFSIRNPHASRYAAAD